jgi:hypothetical protein
MKLKNTSLRPYNIFGQMYLPDEVFELTDKVAIGSINEYIEVGELTVLDAGEVEAVETATEDAPETPKRGRPAKEKAE